MRVRFNERLAVHIYLISTLACVPLTMLTAWLCRGLFQPLGIAVMWLLGCLQVMLIALLVWRRTLRGLTWPCSQLSIDAPLLVNPAYHAHHGQFPLTMTEIPRMTSGPSVLLMATCAMLTLPEKHLSAAQQAVMDFLAPLKLDQRVFLSKHKQIGVRSDGTLSWAICQDGASLRAYTSSHAAAVLEACDFIWDGEAKPLTDQLRQSLLHLWAQEELPPMGFAMASLESGLPVDAVFLGTVLMRRELLPHAQHEVDSLHRQGYQVSLQGLDAATLDRLSRQLHCDPLPDEDDPDVLTLTCAKDADGLNVYRIPKDMMPTRAVSYLRTQMRRLIYRPIQAALILTMVALCCIAGSMSVMVMALMQLTLLSMMAFGPVAPKPLPGVKLKRAILCAGSAVLLTPGMCWATAWFLRVTAGDCPGACMLFLLPVMALLSYQCARLSSSAKPTTVLLPVLLFSAGLIAMSIGSGVTLISGAFALVAGTLTSMAVHSLLQFADGR